MHFGARFAWIAGLTALILTGASAASAQTATFSDISDAVPGRFFDAATTAADELDPNTLIIGLHSGFDFETWKYTDFRASTLAFSRASAMDTISFIVTAPEGYFISSITYTQQGTGSTVRTGKAAGMANWVVADYAADLGAFGTNPTLSQTLDLTDFQLTWVPVSISNSLFGFSTPALGAATVAVTRAAVRVELLALPEPEPEPEPEAEPEPEPESEPEAAPDPEPATVAPAPAAAEEPVTAAPEPTPAQ